MNNKIIEKLKKETNNSSYILYRTKYIKKSRIDIIYSEVLTSQDKISDFIFKSLDYIENIYKENESIYDLIKNNIYNIKVKEVKDYEELVNLLNNGFAILLIDNKILALEVRRDLSRSIDKPITEATIRGPMDSFTENIETNIGLIKRRIKSSKLWNYDLELGEYTKNKISILHIEEIGNTTIQNNIIKTLNKIKIDKVFDSGTLKHLIEKETKTLFPTIATTERPDRVCDELLNGKTIIIVDNSPFALIMPVFLNDYFISEDDKDSKYLNGTLTRILRYTAFFITLLTPALYIAVTTFNQEMIPLDILVNFASQRSTVPIPVFFEALLMILAFDILRETDFRIPNVSNSALSVVGALILGEAAVSAGIVSPIMIIVEAITAISALLFTEPELINAIKWYRILFMIGASTFGMFGIYIVFIFFITNIASINSFGKPYTIPYTPLAIASLKNSIIKMPLITRNKRNKYLTNNIIRLKKKK